MSRVGHRVHQHLGADVGSAGVTRQLAVTAATLAPALQPHTASCTGDAAELLAVLGDPPHRGEAVVGGRGEAGLGGVAVVDRHDHGVGPHAQVAAERVVGVVAAEHPAAAVEVGDDRVRARGRRPVQAVLGGRRRHPAACRRRSRRPRGPAGARRRLASDELPGVLGRHRLDGGSSSSAIISSTIMPRRAAARRTTPSLHCEPVGPAARSRGSPLGHLVARLAVRVDAADVGQEHPRLARHVGAHVPGVGRGVEGDVGAVVDVLHPARLGGLGGLDRLEALLAQVDERVGDPVHVLLDRHHHVRQHRRAARAR
jgi:hypothetical protein